VKNVNINLSIGGMLVILYNVLCDITEPMRIAIKIITPCSNRISSQIAVSFFTMHGNTVTNYKLSMGENIFPKIRKKFLVQTKHFRRDIKLGDVNGI